MPKMSKHLFKIAYFYYFKYLFGSKINNHLFKTKYITIKATKKIKELKVSSAKLHKNFSDYYASLDMFWALLVSK